MQKKEPKEYYIIAASHLRGNVSDYTHHGVKALTPEQAVSALRKSYKHPAGLHGASVYPSEHEFHQGRKPLFTWLSERAKKELHH